MVALSRLISHGSKETFKISKSKKTSNHAGFLSLLILEITVGLAVFLILLYGNVEFPPWVWASLAVVVLIFLTLSYSEMGKRVSKGLCIYFLLCFLLVMPVFTAFTISTNEKTAQNLTSPRETNYFRNILGTNQNYTELYQWEDSNLHWNDSTSMIDYSDPIQIYEYGSARCGGYAILYAELCISQGYPARIVVNVFGNHEWDEVKLNGTWTRVDASPTGAPVSKNIGNPLFYEKVWGKEPILALAFENSSVIDVTGNYRSDGWNPISLPTLLFLVIGVWFAVCIFILWKRRRLFLYNKRVLIYRFRLRQAHYLLSYKAKKFFLPLTATKVVILAGIISVGAFLLLPHLIHLYPSNDTNQTSALLLSNSEILTTIFAITVSVTLIGVQYLAQTYTPRSIKDYFKEPFFAGFVALYIFSILFNLTIGSFPATFSQSTFVFLSFILLFFCLLYLVAYPFHEISKIQPEHVLERISSCIPKNLFEIISTNPYRSNEVNSAREPFIVLEQMTIQSIRNNDYEIYKQCLYCLTATTLKLIDQAKEEYHKTKNEDLLAERTDEIVQFSYRLFDQLKIEAFQTKNEIFLIVLLEDLEIYITRLHEAKAIRALDYVYQLYNSIGAFSFENKLEALAGEYCRSIDRLCTVELQINEFEISPFQEDFSNLKFTDQQLKSQVFNELMFRYFNSQRLDALQNSVKLASDNQMPSEVSLLMFCYSRLLDKIINFKNPQFRFYLFQIVLWNLQGSYRYAAEKKYHLSSLLLEMLSYKVKEMRKLGVTEQEILYLSTSLCSFALISIKNDDGWAIHSLGYQGRVFADSEPKLAVLMAEALGEALRIKADNSTLRNVTDGRIREELESIEKWNRHSNKEITAKVGKLLSSDYGFSEDLY